MSRAGATIATVALALLACAGLLVLWFATGYGYIDDPPTPDSTIHDGWLWGPAACAAVGNVEDAEGRTQITAEEPDRERSTVGRPREAVEHCAGQLDPVSGPGDEDPRLTEIREAATGRREGGRSAALLRVGGGDVATHAGDGVEDDDLGDHLAGRVREAPPVGGPRQGLGVATHANASQTRPDAPSATTAMCSSGA